MQKARQRAALWQFLSQFKNPLVIILLVASAVTAVTGDATGALIIGAIVVMSVTLDFVQAYRAGQAAARLALSVAVTARSLRGNSAVDVTVADLVPGDWILLSAGDLVPADAEVREAHDFFVNPAQLTGEPYPVEKKLLSADESARGGLTPVAWDLDSPHAVLMGSSVVSGSARIESLRTGSHTALGKIAITLADQAPATALEAGTRRFGMLIMRFTVLLVLFTLLVNMALHRALVESFLFAVALAVGLTPELLPMVVMITLTRGALRMTALKVIVKRPSAIEDMGAMDVLSTDKTGTLTEARIRLERYVDPYGNPSDDVLQLAYLNSYFESGVRSPLDDAILVNTAPPRFGVTPRKLEQTTARNSLAGHS